MSNISTGDMAQSYSTRRQNTLLKTTINRLANELASGRIQDIGRRFGGDFSPITNLESTLKNLGSYKHASQEASQFLSAVQTSLGAIQDFVSASSATLILVNETSSLTQIETTVASARQNFDAVVSAMNTQTSGRSLFAGQKTDGPALTGTDSIIAGLQVAIAGQTTASGIITAIDTWFDASGGGYETNGYVGSDTALTAFQVGSGKTAAMPITASDVSIRETLKGLALAALVSEGALVGDNSERGKLLKSAGEKLLSAGGKLIELRSGVGSTEAFIEFSSAQNASEASALEVYRNELLSVDPYDAASELEEVQTQLETLYALTSRMSRLSLVDFLR